MKSSVPAKIEFLAFGLAYSAGGRWGKKPKKGEQSLFPLQKPLFLERVVEQINKFSIIPQVLTTLKSR